MKPYVLTARADEDLRQIWQHIARDNITAADMVDRELHEAMHKLAERSSMGHARADVPGSRYRFLSVYSYLIVSRPKTLPLQVIRVISGYRDLVKHV